MDQLTAMSMFVRVVDKGGFAAAAEGTGMSATMVGNYLRGLEQKLGTRLLNRTTRRQSLTEIGRSYYEQCVDILARVAAAETDAREMRARPRGRLRIGAPISYGAQRVIPALADYLAANPEVTVDVALNDRVVDLTHESFDAAFRIGQLPDSGLIARPLKPSAWLICAAPSYIARHGEPKTPADLMQHNCLAFDFPAGPERNWLVPSVDGTVETVAVGGRLNINSGIGLRMAALAGIGIIMQPEVLIGDDIATGRLVRLLPDHPAPSWPVHLVYLPDRLMTPKLASFVDFAIRRFG